MAIEIISDEPPYDSDVVRLLRGMSDAKRIVYLREKFPKPVNKVRKPVIKHVTWVVWMGIILN